MVCQSERLANARTWRPMVVDELSGRTTKGAAGATSAAEPSAAMAMPTCCAQRVGSRSNKGR